MVILGLRLRKQAIRAHGNCAITLEMTGLCSEVFIISDICIAIVIVAEFYINMILVLYT